MKYVTVFVIFIVILQSSTFVASQRSSEVIQEKAVRGLTRRLLGDNSVYILINVDFKLKKNDRDLFILRNVDKYINITASSGVAAAYGFHHYLKYFCSAHISWDFNQLNLTNCQKNSFYESIKFNDKYRYYQNACTPSYSFVWWDWKKWEEHIDWMAMQGFNLVPAINGQEAIWERVYRKLGMTQEDIDAHFTGPAFLAWNRMGNVQGFASPLSSSWHHRQLQLNQKIVERMRQFGISTVLPAFSGLVPKALKRLYPNTTMYQLPRWNNFNDSFCCTYLLAPTHPLFLKIGTLFMRELAKEFGTDHYYSCDTFNEMTPFTNDLEDLRKIGSAIYTSMTASDPEAIWIMQGWLFHHEMLFWTKARAAALLTSVPIGRMIILDLQSEQFPQYERLENYFGQPYIWCMLHNFGGTLGMFGSADIINNRIFEARKMENSTLIGTGITPEGIDQNYVIYDLMSEMSYRNQPANLEIWFKDYSIRRYGKENPNVIQAWDILRKTVYSYDSILLMRGKFVYNRSPRTTLHPWTWYNKTSLFEALKLLSSDLRMLTNDNYRHDVIDLQRQVLQNLIDDIYVILIKEFRRKHLGLFEIWKHKMLHAMDLTEKVLSLDKKWLLGKWLNAAKAIADNDEDRILYEYNARNQITLWGPNGEIKDYANKQWSGIVEDFFIPRWKLFLEHMSDSLSHNIRFNEKGARQDVFEKVEEPFTFSRKVYPVEFLDDVREELLANQAELENLFHYVHASEQRKKSPSNNAKIPN